MSVRQEQARKRIAQELRNQARLTGASAEHAEAPGLAIPFFIDTIHFIYKIPPVQALAVISSAGAEGDADCMR